MKNFGMKTAFALVAVMAVRAALAMPASQIFARDVAQCVDGADGPSNVYGSSADCIPNCYCLENPNDSAQGSICKGYCFVLEGGRGIVLGYQCHCKSID